MNQTYHFMAGLPRSGSTLLSALLNQHPDIYSSPQTGLLQLIYDWQSNAPDVEFTNFTNGEVGHNNIINKVPENYYQHIEKKVIIDKNRAWGTPYNFTEIAPLLNPEGKVIITMRPILEILASMVKAIQRSEIILENDPWLNKDLFVTHYRPRQDAQIENIMRLNGELDIAIYSVFNLLTNYKDRVLVLWFDDLLNKPQESLSKIYNFLGVQNTVNNFGFIKPVDVYNDMTGYGVIGLHDVATTLKKPETNPSDYLSEFIKTKYAHTLDFLNDLYPTQS